jgi:hypothetical protein
VPAAPAVAALPPNILTVVMRNQEKAALAERKDNQSHCHEDRRQCERKLVSVFRPDYRQRHHRQGRANVNGKIEPEESVRTQRNVPGPLLVVRHPHQR